MNSRTDYFEFIYLLRAFESHQFIISLHHERLLDQVKLRLNQSSENLKRFNVGPRTPRRPPQIPEESIDQ
jgi:hypothetical protein